jgi:hypothetical protein
MFGFHQLINLHPPLNENELTFLILAESRPSFSKGIEEMVNWALRPISSIINKNTTTEKLI